MKALLACLLIVCGIAITLACYSQKDCKEEGYCCTGGITPWLKGSCRKLGEEGVPCDPNPPNTEKYFLRCPCIEGLKCVKKENTVSAYVCVKE